MNTEESRKYILTDAELLTYSARLLNYIRRDIAEFAIFGVTDAKVDEFEAMREAFKKLPSDAAGATQATLAKEMRNASRDHLIAAMGNVVLRFELAFGSNHTKLKELEVDELAKQSEDTILNRAEHFLAAIADNAVALEEYGQTAAATAQFEVEIADFESKLIEVGKTNNARTTATNLRKSKGNEFYDKVTNYTDMGKKVFRKKDSLKFANYVIYGSSTPVSVHGAPTNLRFIGSDELEWDEIDNAVSYTVAVSTDNGITWKKDIPTSENSLTVPIDTTGIYQYKVRGRNAKGLGEYSEPLEKHFGVIDEGKSS